MRVLEGITLLPWAVLNAGHAALSRGAKTGTGMPAADAPHPLKPQSGDHAHVQMADDGMGDSAAEASSFPVPAGVPAHARGSAGGSDTAPMQDASRAAVPMPAHGKPPGPRTRLQRRAARAAAPVEVIDMTLLDDDDDDACAHGGPDVARQPTPTSLAASGAVSQFKASKTAILQELRAAAAANGPVDPRVKRDQAVEQSKSRPPTQWQAR